VSTYLITSYLVIMKKSNATISGNEEVKSAITVCSSEDRTSADISAASPVQYQSSHETFEARMTMLQYYGLIKDVAGDGSCGYHALILFLQRMEVIDNDISVSQFCQNILHYAGWPTSSRHARLSGVCLVEATSNNDF
jgi:hypothetical protein